jgi:hypothetical protein
MPAIGGSTGRIYIVFNVEYCFPVIYKAALEKITLLILPALFVEAPIKVSPSKHPHPHYLTARNFTTICDNRLRGSYAPFSKR